jgi:hypothetical protein
MAGVWLLFPDAIWSVMTFFVACVSAFLVAYQDSKDLRIAPVADGWYELRNLSPRFVEELSRLRHGLNDE